ncbi:transketolase [Pelagicoccus sp. NFK12]|uniref:Transketolase n=1 Tax=Pelagicoccus enzymogenes TaxID=2773457 RepID=A0A927FAA4_9BACT|nr:transketolase C-terminal domain-containing protein [Pelagicoccus enzymogenes]MBD5781397.1 transketolase [Pelagicoccus enzymogenes]MDQ8199171.1 transketolase C-terminal domain-containing protein [Pelagicoccus enzymogenes]
MRNAFAQEIEKLAQDDPRIILLSGDIGNRLFDSFKERFPERFINCGVAEANMVGMAAGLAMAGMRPVIYTIASFLIYRPYEQLRLDVGYHGLPVCIVGVGGGLSYASNGATHHALEDIAVMRAIPGMQVLNAGDAWEVRAGLADALRSEKPCYLRIGKKREPLVHTEAISQPLLGRCISLGDGKQAALLASGNLLPHAAEARQLLSARGTSISLFSSPSVHPLDTELLETLFESGQPIFILEEHNRNGGLGTATLEWANDQGLDTRQLIRIGTPNTFIHRTTTQQDSRETCGLTAQDIADKIHSRLRQEANPT